MKIQTPAFVKQCMSWYLATQAEQSLRPFGRGLTICLQLSCHAQWAPFTSCVRHAKHVAIGVAKPSYVDCSTRHGQNAELVLRKVRIEIEGHAFFSQGADSRTHILHTEPEYCVFMRRKIRHSRNAQCDSPDVENSGEVILVRHYKSQSIAIELYGTLAISRTDDDSRLRSLQNSHVRGLLSFGLSAMQKAAH